MKQFKYKFQTYIAFFYDFSMAILAFHLSWHLRYDHPRPHNYVTLVLSVAFIQQISFIFNGLYKGIWRFSSTPDLLRVIKGVSIGILLSMGSLFIYSRLQDIPRSIFLIDWFILIVALGSGRFAYRLWKDSRLVNPNGLRTLIVGAGSAGDKLFREIKSNPKVNANVVGFIDDDQSKIKRTIQGLPIFGSTNDLLQVIDKFKIEKIILAIPSASNAEVKRIFDICSQSAVELQTLPSMSQILDGKIELSLLRKIRPEDLLGRESVTLDVAKLGSMLNNKKILVTGAGGSIGSELVEQIAKFSPEILILFDISELFLFNLENKLKEKFPNLNFVSLIGDVKNIERLRNLFETYHPQVVFHAAAYKHVPLMEKNPVEAVMTNVGGTRNLCELSNIFKVEKIVFVSTDKAVNPTNVMGTTKRIAEMVCQNYQLKSTLTKYMVVRFGNVLGSNGSVIPRFKEQIERGGPVTVTHPEITRFFMSIPEASQLILQAASMGQGGEIFILEMGEPVKILELAEQMIKMAGLKPNEDIKIKFIGLRPGEKLYEELLATNEHSLPTTHQKVKVAGQRNLPINFEQRLEQLLLVHANTNEYELRTELKYLVPELHDPKTIF